MSENQHVVTCHNGYSVVWSTSAAYTLSQTEMYSIYLNSSQNFDCSRMQMTWKKTFLSARTIIIGQIVTTRVTYKIFIRKQF